MSEYKVHPKHKGRNDEKCPKCRCKKTESTGNMIEYPEVYQQEHCINCGFLVSMADNSRAYGCYEFEDFVIEI